MTKNLKSFFAIFCLLATSVVTVATSKKQDGSSPQGTVTPESLARRDYYVASSCPQSISQEVVTIDNEMIDYPAGRSFYNYGLPTYNLNVTFSNQVNGDMNGRQRSCVRSEQASVGTPLVFYTCYENGRMVCQVSFEAVQ